LQKLQVSCVRSGLECTNHLLLPACPRWCGVVPCEKWTPETTTAPRKGNNCILILFSPVVTDDFYRSSFCDWFHIFFVLCFVLRLLMHFAMHELPPLKPRDTCAKRGRQRHSFLQLASSVARITGARHGPRLWIVPFCTLFVSPNYPMHWLASDNHTVKIVHSHH
jgi:hypothetical protein